MSDQNKSEDIASTHLWTNLLPEFAPLPQPFVAHIFQYAHRLRSDHDDLRFSSPHESTHLHHIWRLIQYARKQAFFYLDPVVHPILRVTHANLSSAWLRTHVPVFDEPFVDQKDVQVKEEKTPSRATIGDWLSKHLLHSKRYGVLEENSVAALLMMRSLFQSRRDWLPVGQNETEPFFWVWGLSPGQRLPQPYPYPLPAGIAANTLLWSSWPGIAWQPGWHFLEGRGAIAWAGTHVLSERDQWYWKLSEAELRAWDSSLTPTTLDAIRAFKAHALPGYSIGQFSDTQAWPDEQFMLLHTLAEMALIRHGTRMLERTLTYYYATTVPPQDALDCDDLW